MCSESVLYNATLSRFLVLVIIGTIGSLLLRSTCLQSVHYCLQEAALLDKGDTSILFDLSLELAEHRQINAAVDCAKHCFNRGCGTRVHGWRFLALVLSVQEKHAEAEAVLDSALEETSLLEQGPLLRTRAKVQLALGQPLLAVQNYQVLLALLQAEKKELEAGVVVRAKVNSTLNNIVFCGIS